MENLETNNPETTAPDTAPASPETVPPAYQQLADNCERIRQEIGKAVVGMEGTIDFLLAALFTRSHVLLEGVPGLAKTLLAKSFSRSLNLQFSRIQFTPDLMPGDVLGTTVFNLNTSEFSFKKGPVFANLILADEINRAPAKTQAATLEVMEEFTVTIDGSSYAMSQPFMVIATQNPVEQEGTYKLPEAQLDRFIFRLRLEHLSVEDEIRILDLYKDDFQGKLREEVKPLINEKDIADARSLIEKTYIKPELIAYIAQLVTVTRNHPDIYLGASPRAGIALLKTSKALAAMAGRNFVIPDDIRNASIPVLNHRLILSPEREMEGMNTDEVILKILEQVEIPR